jgi:5'-3' exonuclease
MAKELLLIDGKNYIFRQHYTHRTLCTSDGRPTSILYGGLCGLASIMRKFPHADLAFVWDGGGKTWRHRLYPEYKANRKRSPDTELAFQQLPAFEQALNLLGIPQFKQKGVEADDLIGCICSTAKAYTQVIIHSGDQDFYQLVDLRVRILAREKKKAGLRVITAGVVALETGIAPRDWVSYRALMGDSSDNIPPVRRGVGPKTALLMLQNGVRVDNFKRSKKLPKSVLRLYPWFWGAVLKQYLMNVELCTIQTAGSKNKLDMAPKFFSREFTAAGMLGLRKRQYDAFLTLCADYELTEVLGQRRLLFAKRQKN